MENVNQIIVGINLLLSILYLVPKFARVRSSLFVIFITLNCFLFLEQSIELILIILLTALFTLFISGFSKSTMKPLSLDVIKKIIFGIIMIISVLIINIAPGANFRYQFDLQNFESEIVLFLVCLFSLAVIIKRVKVWS